MNILLIGSGGREHALAWAISGSPLCDRLFVAPGNPGTAQCGDNVVIDIADHQAVIAFCRLQKIDLVVVCSHTHEEFVEKALEASKHGTSSAEVSF